MATPGPSLRRPLGQRLTVFDLGGAAITHLPYLWTRVFIDSGCNGRPVGLESSDRGVLDSML